MIGFLFIFCFLTGFSFINIVKKKEELLNIIIYSIPIGVLIHSIIFIILCIFKIYYSKWLFIIFSLLTLLSFVYRQIKIEISNKKIPFYYYLFLGFVVIRLLMMANTGFFEFYNYDEFTAYQKNVTYLYSFNRFDIIFDTFAPINYFIGFMSLEFTGLSLTSARLFAPIFYALTSLFIFKKLIDNKVDRHIASLLSMLFLISSSEMLILAKSFYTNIYFMFYFIAGAFGIIEYFILNEKNKIPIFSLIMCLGAMLTRKEALYFIIFILFVFSIYLLIKKQINKKNFLILNSLSLITIIWSIVYKIFVIPKEIDMEKQGPILEKLTTRLDFSNLKIHLKNLWDQTFGLNAYYFNTLMYLVFAFVFFYLVFKIFKKNKNKITKSVIWIMFFEFVYIGIVVLTEFFDFTINEFLNAASFSRYLSSIIPINFILLGIILFSNSNSNHNLEQTEHKQLKINRKNPKILLIIPAYNEEKNILRTYEQIKDYNKLNKCKYDVIVINDGSKDNTSKICHENNIPVIDLVRNLGIGGAVQTGYKYAFEKDYDIAIQFDGDGQHDVNYIKDIINPILAGDSNMVIGSRFIEKSKSGFQSTKARRLGINIISKLIKIKTGIKIYDTTSGFRAGDKNVIMQFAHTYPTEYPEPISSVEIINHNMKIVEVPVNMKERKEGNSSITSWKQVYYMINVILTILLMKRR